MILLDTSGLLSALDGSEPKHEASAAALVRATGPRLLSPFVLAELDYLLAKRVSFAVAQAFLAEVARGAYQLEAFQNADIAEAREIVERHGDLKLGLADASIVVLANRHGTTDLLTLDERRFRVVTNAAGSSFRLHPADDR